MQYRYPITASRSSRRISPSSSTGYYSAVCSNPKVECVRGLPDETDAMTLLEFLNDAFQSVQGQECDSKNRKMEHEQQIPHQDPIQTVLVVGNVAILVCSSARAAAMILQRTTRVRIPIPITYEGQILTFGRPRNYNRNPPMGFNNERRTNPTECETFSTT